MIHLDCEYIAFRGKWKEQPRKSHARILYFTNRNPAFTKIMESDILTPPSATTNEALEKSYAVKYE